MWFFEASLSCFSACPIKYIFSFFAIVTNFGIYLSPQLNLWSFLDLLYKFILFRLCSPGVSWIVLWSSSIFEFIHTKSNQFGVSKICSRDEKCQLEAFHLHNEEVYLTISIKDSLNCRIFVWALPSLFRCARTCHLPFSLYVTYVFHNLLSSNYLSTESEINEFDAKMWWWQQAKGNCERVSFGRVFTNVISLCTKIASACFLSISGLDHVCTTFHVSIEQH